MSGNKLNKILKRAALTAFLCLAIVSCDEGVVEDPGIDFSYQTKPENNHRDWLTLDEFNGVVESVDAPYHNDYFMPVGATNNELTAFNGVIEFKGGQLLGFPPNYSTTMREFPTFKARFVSSGGFLIPENRDIIIPETNSSHWRIILSPGTTWSESTDNGMSRASFPFALVETTWNTALNGLATFLYDEDEVSNLRVQIVQHTAPGFRDEAAATIPIALEATPDFDSTALANEFESELLARLPVAKWSDLTTQYPNIVWSRFNSGMLDTDISVSAIWLNEQLYIQGCQTLYGEYPYCRFMRNGVYSATKPAAGGLAIAYLVQRYGEEILDYYIKDYVDINARHNGWDEVRFIDAINMATGIGNNDHDRNSTNFSPDENVHPQGDWSRALSTKEKLDITFLQYGNYPWGPGEVFRYNTGHYFVLSVAMDKLVREREGVGLWRLLKDNVYEPIGIAHTPMMHTTEPDGSRGVPILGVGLYPTVEDFTKITRLFHGEGLHNGSQILHSETVEKQLFRTDDLGFQSHWHNNVDGEGRYLMSFFSVPYRAAEGCLIHVPLFSGAGGNLATILPNGVIAIRFADAHNYDARSMVEVTGALAPLCD